MRVASKAAPAGDAGLLLREDGTVALYGAWTLANLAVLERQVGRLRPPRGGSVICDGAGITTMDASGAVLLERTLATLGRRGATVQLRDMRPELTGLLQMVAGRWTSVREGRRPGFVARVESVGRWIVENARGGRPMAGFLGAVVAAGVEPFVRERRIRVRPLLAAIQVDGFGALPIVGLLCFLMGMVIAYQAAEQLASFGVSLLIVDLAGISILREIAPVITAILVAGRSGSSYAAQLGTMNVTEELDAIRSLGVSPLELLVVPRVLGLLVALPLLTVFGDILGILGSMIVASAKLQISFAEFVQRLRETVNIQNYVFGLVKAPIFALIIGLVGCYQGLSVRGGVDAVGRHTTVSVVQAVFWVIVFDALASVVMSALGY